MDDDSFFYDFGSDHDPEARRQIDELRQKLRTTRIRRAALQRRVEQLELFAFIVVGYLKESEALNEEQLRHLAMILDPDDV